MSDWGQGDITRKERGRDRARAKDARAEMTQEGVCVSASVSELKRARAREKALASFFADRIKFVFGFQLSFPEKTFGSILHGVNVICKMIFIETQKGFLQPEVCVIASADSFACFHGIYGTGMESHENRQNNTLEIEKQTKLYHSTSLSTNNSSFCASFLFVCQASSFFSSAS
jgi:hypothetical protein